MTAKILCKKHLIAKDISSGMYEVKKEYPYARYVAYKMDKDFRYELKKNYKNRTMTIWFVDDFTKLEGYHDKP